MTLPADELFATRYETHFGDRVMRCFAHRPASLLDMLAQSVACAPEAEALVCEATRVTYRQLDGIAARVARQRQADQACAAR